MPRCGLGLALSNLPAGDPPTDVKLVPFVLFLHHISRDLPLGMCGNMFQIAGLVENLTLQRIIRDWASG